MSGVPVADARGLALGGCGVECAVSESRGVLLVWFIAERLLDIGCALTAVNPPAFTAVKPEETGALGGVASDTGGVASSSDAFRAAEARAAGDSYTPFGDP